MRGIEISEHKQKSKQKQKTKKNQNTKKKLAQTLNKKRSLFFLFYYRPLYLIVDLLPHYKLLKVSKT